MNRDQVIAKLREHEPELKAAGIVRLAVFGSVARGTTRPNRMSIFWLISQNEIPIPSPWEELRPALPTCLERGQTCRHPNG